MPIDNSADAEQARPAEAGPHFAESDTEGAPSVPDGASKTGARRWCPRWLALFIGKVALRICPSAKDLEKCRGCELRALCRCAYEQLREAAAVERRVWLALACCGGALILYVLVSLMGAS